MRYTYTYRTTARDLWQLSMYYIYGSLAGLCNIIFTVAAFALGFSRWDQAQGIVRCLIVLGCCLFTVIQPLMIYAKAKKQAAGIAQDTQVSIDDNGLYIRVGDDTSQLPWKSVKRISRKPAMIIIFSDTTHGFIFTNRVLGNEKEEFYRYASSKVEGRNVHN
jgi:lipopolysaccharide export LptBFGC system permease protein LptF